MRQEGTFARLRRAIRREDGASITPAVLTFGTLFLFLCALQAGLWFLSNYVAQAAADTAYMSARGYQSTPASGQDAAQQMLGSMGAFLGDPGVVVDSTGERVTVTVTGSAPSILPGIPLPPIAHTVTGPVERWVDP